MTVQTPEIAKKRISAMNRFIKYNKAAATHPDLAHPIKLNDKIYFVNAISMVEVNTVPDDITLYDKEKDGEPSINIMSYMNFTTETYDEMLNINAILDKAKNAGYKFTKKYLNDFAYKSNKVVILFDDIYINPALLELAYSIINDHKDAYVELMPDNKGIRVITSLGKALVLPCIITNLDGITVIDAEGCG